MTLLVSVKSKLLLAFVVVLAVITLLNVATTAYLTNRQGQAEAFNHLSQQLMQLQDDVQGARDALLGTATEAAGDEKNLSDMAILYSQELARRKDPNPLREQALGLDKAVSLNRLQLILGSARLSSLAVYLNGSLSHYVTPDLAGMTAWRAGRPVVIGAPHDARQESRLDNWQNWSEHSLPILVTPREPLVEQVTVRFDFLDDQLLALRVVVPIQAVTRSVFHETIAERLAIATRDLLRRPETDGVMPEVVGAFVFSKAIDRAFLDDIAANTGMLPAILSPDGRHRVEARPTGIPAGYRPAPDDFRIRLQPSEHGGTAYYQALKAWRVEGDSALILGSALSQEGTVASVRQTILSVVGAAVLILSLGAALGYVLVSRMVSPIKSLTAAATSLELGVRDLTGRAGDEHALAGALGRYLDRPIARQSNDEIGELTTAFNAMARRLHDLMASLARSEAYLAEAQRLSRMGSFSWNVETGAIVWSDETFRIFEYTPAPASPTPAMLFERVHPDDRQRLKELMNRGAQNAADIEFDHRLRMPDGAIKYLHIVGRAMRSGSGGLEFVGAVMDVTEQHHLYATLQHENAERKRAEEALEDLAGRLIHAQEEERSRIGRELHDHISQRLGLLAIKLDQCHIAASAAGDTMSATFEDLRRETSEITEDIHRLSHRLHSSMLDHLGLVPALHRLVEEFSERHHIAIDFSHTSPLPPVSPDVALCLFRIVEEALTNLTKHSQARSARVNVVGDPDGVGVTVDDAGIGFDPLRPEHEAGLGLISMRERLRLVHGTIRIESAPSRGTRVDAWVPLSKPVDV